MSAIKKKSLKFYFGQIFAFTKSIDTMRKVFFFSVSERKFIQWRKIFKNKILKVGTYINKKHLLGKMIREWYWRNIFFFANTFASKILHDQSGIVNCLSRICCSKNRELENHIEPVSITNWCLWFFFKLLIVKFWLVVLTKQSRLKHMCK